MIYLVWKLLTDIPVVKLALLIGGLFALSALGVDVVSPIVDGFAAVVDMLISGAVGVVDAILDWLANQLVDRIV